MLEIHFYGKFREKASDSSPSGNSIIHMDYIDSQTMLDILNRLNIDPDETGELFVNSLLAGLDTEIPFDQSRLGIFPVGMHLLDGGQHLKGHGYIRKQRRKKPNYW